MPKATNIGWQEASKIKHLPNNTVLISINEEYDDLYPLELNRKDERILTVRFCDITAPREYNGKNIIPITNEIALKILDFININLGKDVIVSCAAGISRSAAICLYLNIIHGYELKHKYWHISRPYVFVLGRLIVKRREDLS